MLHADEFITILQYLTAKEIAMARCVSRTWKKDADNPRSWKYAKVTYNYLRNNDVVIRPQSIYNCRELILSSGKPRDSIIHNQQLVKLFMKIWLDAFPLLLKQGLFTNLTILELDNYIITPLIIDALRYATKLSKLTICIEDTDECNVINYKPDTSVNLTDSMISLLQSKTLTYLKLSGYIDRRIICGLVDGLAISNLITFSFTNTLLDYRRCDIMTYRESYPFKELAHAISCMVHLKNLQVPWIPKNIGNAECLIARNIYYVSESFNNLREMHFVETYNHLRLNIYDNLVNITSIAADFITWFSRTKLEKLTLPYEYVDTYNFENVNFYKDLFPAISEHKYLTNICITMRGDSKLSIRKICLILNTVGRCPILKDLMIIVNCDIINYNPNRSKVQKVYPTYRFNKYRKKSFTNYVHADIQNIIQIIIAANPDLVITYTRNKIESSF